MITIITGIFAAVARNVILGWLWRRLQEWIGIAGVALSIFSSMPPDQQAFIVAVLTGHGGALSIGAAISFVLYAWSQVQSYRATTHDQVVAGNQKVKIKELPTYTQDEVLDVVERQTGKRPQIVPKP